MLAMEVYEKDRAEKKPCGFENHIRYSQPVFAMGKIPPLLNME